MSGTDVAFSPDMTCFFFFFFCGTHHSACGVLVPQAGTEPVVPALEAEHPNQWATGEVPMPCFFFSRLFILKNCKTSGKLQECYNRGLCISHRGSPVINICHIFFFFSFPFALSFFPLLSTYTLTSIFFLNP